MSEKIDLTLTPDLTGQVQRSLEEANRCFSELRPGDSAERQPVHTVYGGAHLFRAESAAKLGSSALRTLNQFASGFVDFARLLGLAGSDTLPRSDGEIRELEQALATPSAGVRRSDFPAWLACTVYGRVTAKLEREPIEDYRIDFEDGYGNRSDGEEDGHARSSALEVARGMETGSLPPFLGIRIKPFTEEFRLRAVRTLDIFVSTLARRTGGALPPHFVVTLPKVVIPEQVAALVELFTLLESRTPLPRESLKLELMIETPQSLFNAAGEITLPGLIEAARGRCRSAHFGVYDYTASSNITAAHQQMTHPACDFARSVMKAALAGSGIWISDGATNVLPVGPHAAGPDGELSEEQVRENRETVRRAWKLCFADIRHSLRNGYYQGWDLHPAQLPVRYAAVYDFFLNQLDSATLRLKSFVQQAARASLMGDVFDDAATGRGLLNFFLTGHGCGAITDEELARTGLSRDQIRSRSFATILSGSPERE